MCTLRRVIHSTSLSNVTCAQGNFGTPWRKNTGAWSNCPDNSSQTENILVVKIFFLLLLSLSHSLSLSQNLHCQRYFKIQKRADKRRKLYIQWRNINTITTGDVTAASHNPQHWQTLRDCSVMWFSTGEWDRQKINYRSKYTYIYLYSHLFTYFALLSSYSSLIVIEVVPLYIAKVTLDKFLVTLLSRVAGRYSVQAKKNTWAFHVRKIPVEVCVLTLHKYSKTMINTLFEIQNVPSTKCKKISYSAMEH